MGAAYFYHLTQSPLEVTLPMLLDKCQQVGWRVLVRGTSDERIKWLDEKLWLGDDIAFRPHGIAGGAHDAEQPVLLTDDAQLMPVNRADCLMAIDQAGIEPAEVAAFERVCVLFDGNDPEALATARSQWKSLTDAGCSAQYWSQSSGQWQKQAET